MRKLSLATFSLALFGVIGLMPQASATPEHESAKTEAKKAMSNQSVTYGRVKEITPAQKVVIDVDDAVDKSFDLTDKDLSVKLGKGLKVGDPVKVEEHSVAGKTDKVTISKHSAGGVTHGDPK